MELTANQDLAVNVETDSRQTSIQRESIVVSPVLSKARQRLLDQAGLALKSVKKNMSIFAKAVESLTFRKENSLQQLVHQHVTAESGESQESITRKGLVSYVLENLRSGSQGGQRLVQGSVPVLSVSKTGLTSKVYNFNALGQGHYLIYVDGKLVVTQNCEYLFPVKRHSSGVSKMRLAGL